MLKAKYTIHLKTLLDDAYMKSEIDKAMETYPLYVKKSKEEFIPSYVPTREELNKKLLNYYKYREIGFDTPGRFIDELQATLEEIMPYYNQFFLTIDQDFDMRYNADYKRTININRTGEDSTTTDSSGNSTSNTSGSDSSTTNSNITNNNKTVKVDTPQNDVNAGTVTMDGMEYASQIDFTKDNNTESGTTSGTTNTETTSNSTSSSTATGTNKQDELSEEHLKGNYGQVSFQSLIRQYRENIINVEQMIIKDKRIQELFMVIY